jgi:catechol 2,3-dioxygenase-like lactoylglutathione lyase family enzyme
MLHTRNFKDRLASLRFYTEKLGCKRAFEYGDPIFYAQVVRDGGRLNLRWAKGPVFDAAFLKREGFALCATMAVHMAEPLFVAFQASGVDVHQALRTEPWGARTVIIADPDGNLVLLAGEERKASP